MKNEITGLAIEADGYAIGCQEVEQDYGYDRRPKDMRPSA